MGRYRVTGAKWDWTWEFLVEVSRYVDATDADAASRKAGGDLVGIEAVVECPDDEGRGWLWRVLRWLKVI